MKKNITVQSLAPRELSQWDFERLNEVTQDMWAEWIWEFVQCQCCHTMMSKKDIFWHLEKEIYDETVQKIMWILSLHEIPCISCGWKTKFIYGHEHVEKIQERLLKSEESFLVVCKNDVWEIVWYEEGYFDTLENIFSREFAYHYEEIWLPEIQKRIQNILWYTPEKMFVMSSIWFLQSYISFFTLFEVLKEFALHLPERHLFTPAITEVDEKNSLHMVTQVMGWISLWFQESSYWREKIINTGTGYKSHLKVIPEVGRNYKHYLSWGVKHFLALSKAQK